MFTRKLMSKNTKKLKVGFVFDDSLDRGDGVQQYILTLGDWLLHQGHKVHYLVGETKRSDIPNVYSFSKNIRVKFNGNTLSIPLPAKNPELKTFLERQKYDILHVQVPYSPFFAEKVIKNAPKASAVVGTFHILPYNLVGTYGTKLLGVIVNKSLKMFDRHMSTSTASRDFAKKTFGIDSIVMPNMVDIAKFKPKDGFKRSNEIAEIVFLGRLVERKGCQYLINALIALNNSNSQIKFHLTICGVGRLEAKLKQTINSSNIKNRVDFVGYVSENQKVTYLQKADITVFPSYAGESFGIVLLEAMASESGVVLGGMNPGYETVLGKVPGSLVNVKNVNEFSAKLLKFIENKDFRDKIHQSQQKIVKQYDKNIVAQRIFDVYQQLQKVEG